MSSFIGPALPSHLQMKVEFSENKETSKSNENQVEQDRESDALIGPSLPPDFIQRVNRPSHFSPELTQRRKTRAPEIGPSLPPHLHIACSDKDSPPRNEGASIGPALPPHLKNAQRTESHNQSQNRCKTSVMPLSEQTDEDVISVLNPDAFVSGEEAYRDGPQDEMYGPALPPGLRVRSSSYTEDGETAQGILGPCLPSTLKLSKSVDHRSSDSNIVGPVPVSEGVCNATYIQDQFDDRALRMKRKLTGKDECHGSGPMKRESWMLELPPDRAADFGLGPRQFRARARPESGDRSVWTDTPTDRLRKKHSPGDKSDATDELELRVIEERDKEMQRLAEKHSGKKRQESLLETHQKELKKKRKKEGKHEERRPFDRSTDLQANRFDEAQKKTIFKKAALLNDRFSSGQRKFL